ncbi:uncharacterized protein KRP23_358 [Phytophthora ramorum]|uniref:uncharacterized protein n=1 Tax=Phytophthora ramorum TaxID=164328 RepID=UPI0030B5DDBA|nr:hypothetical protein KRP23_358 [Phytophthora ramorum]
MLRSTRNDTPTGEDLKIGDAETPAGMIQLSVIESSDAETSMSSSDSEDQTFVGHANVSTKSSVEKVPEPKPVSAPPTKVLFLDGVRGLAAILVVTQHSKEYMQSLNLGAVAVDAFFVLSSFLLTWLFMKKCMKLLTQGASFRTHRDLPLSFEDQHRYFLVKAPADFDLYKTLTFDFDHRFHVLWTLPLEIGYYFVIPLFVLAAAWVATRLVLGAATLAGWIIHEGSVVFVKLDSSIKKTGFKFRWWHTLLLRLIEGLAIAVLLSVCFQGLFFDWVHVNPVPAAKGFPFVSALLTLVFVIEMIHPSCVSAMFEWSILRFWGKISFSVYLLHSFVVWNPTISAQPKYFNRLFARMFLTLALSTATFYLIEYPSQVMAQRISRFLTAQEKKASRGLVSSRVWRISLRKPRTAMEPK